MEIKNKIAEIKRIGLGGKPTMISNYELKLWNKAQKELLEELQQHHKDGYELIDNINYRLKKLSED